MTISKWPYSRLESYYKYPHIWVDPQLNNCNWLILSTGLSANLIFQGNSTLHAITTHDQTSSESFIDSLFTFIDHLASKRMKPLSAMYRLDPAWLTACRWMLDEKLRHWEGFCRWPSFLSFFLFEVESAPVSSTISFVCKVSQPYWPSVRK